MLYWGADFLINLICYFVVYRWILFLPFRKKVLWYIVTAGALCPFVMVLCHYNVLGYEGYVTAIASLAALLILAERERLKVAFVFPIVFFASGTISILVIYLLAFITKTSYSDFTAVRWRAVAAEAVFPLVFFAFILFFKKLHEERESVVFSIPQYMIALLGSGSLFIIIGVAQGVMKGETEFADWTSPLTLCLAIVGIVFIALVLWQSSIGKKAFRYKMENDYYQLCLKRQEAHIREIVENDQKIRRFRHDINAHLTAIEQCIQANDMPQLKSYLERMRAETSKLEVQKFTGIGVVDAIISEWYQKAVSENIEWEWDGGLLGQTGTDAYDLCVLFSNLLSNAVEAAEQVEEGAERKIHVSYGSFRDRICIRVSNTCRNNPETGRRHGTTKSDYQNHGFGLLNIRNTVAKANGEIQIAEEQGLFSVEIII
ncbi:MAG: GHKL domain-containing protein [Lachnospiraceae bacterium]|nr:GHKL domain-containing protein [Lachnospiraceae bacterium]